MSSSDASTETTTETTSASPASSTAAPAPASLPRRRGSGRYRVIMVCTGNICRSAMAEIVLNDRLVAAGLHMREPDDVSRATNIAITSHAAHRITDAEIAEADLLLAMTDSHWNILQRRAAGLGAEPSRIRMYREFDPAAAPQTEAVAAGRASRGVLNVPDPASA